MKIYALVTGFLMLGTVVFAQIPNGQAGKSACTIEVDGIQREFIVYQPSEYKSHLFPVVFMFHGTSGNGEKFFNISGWKEKADKEGLIAVFPSALRYCIETDARRKHTTKWNDGKLEQMASAGQELKDDVSFFREMVRYLANYYPIDQKRIYASGFSNGANFVGRLTLEASDILAATSMSAGYLQDSGFNAKTPIPSYLTLGDLNLKEHTGELPEWGESVIETPGLHAKIMVMVDKLQLERFYHIEKTDSLLTFLFEQNKGDAGNQFRFSLIRDLEHRFPNGRNHRLVAADLFWDFFQRFSK